jgi:hypothetical protein
LYGAIFSHGDSLHLINEIIVESIMEDERCCGSGTCIINDEGSCWCGQKWDGSRMYFPEVGVDANSVHSSGAQTLDSSQE